MIDEMTLSLLTTTLIHRIKPNDYFGCFYMNMNILMGGDQKLRGIIWMEEKKHD